MIKRLTAIGGSLGLIIDKPIADLYQLSRTTSIEITPKENGLDIRFIRESDDQKGNDENIPSVAPTGTTQANVNTLPRSSEPSVDPVPEIIPHQRPTRIIRNLGG